MNKTKENIIKFQYLTLLDLPEEHKFYVDYYGDQGAGKNQEKARIAYESRSQEIFNKLREIFGENIDRILVCVGAAGGTGGGSVNTLSISQNGISHT